jgi:hypothetical protein
MDVVGHDYRGMQLEANAITLETALQNYIARFGRKWVVG